MSFVLQPGDALLYHPKPFRLFSPRTWSGAFFGWAIAIKTSSRPIAISHIETYLGDGVSAASRDGVGVNTYPVRLSELTLVLRPTEPFNIEAARAWHRRHLGARYDWKGIYGFTLLWVPEDEGRFFCSEYWTLVSRAGGVEPFSASTGAHTIAPCQATLSPRYLRVWQRGDPDPEVV